MDNRHYILTLKDHGDERGGLCVIENYKDFPFVIKRVFYNFCMNPNMRRGMHANRNSTFGLVSIHGSCNVLVDDGKNKETYNLDSPFKLLIIGKMLWKEMYDFSDDNVLLIVSDSIYDKYEYISDYTDFCKIVDQSTI